MTLKYNLDPRPGENRPKGLPSSRLKRPAASRAAIAFLALFAALPAVQCRAALDPQDFAQNCANCHTIGGGRLTGPDLKDVSKRRSREWLLKFVPDPGKMIDGGDPTAIELLKAYNNVRMTTLAGMDAARVERLLALIDEESLLENSRFSGAGLINRPLLPADILAGRDLFLGRAPLKNGGPACASCHSVGGLGGLGGGLLGPDLTAVYARLGGGEKTLAAWLVSPASPLMKPVYNGRALDPLDILPLVAFLKDEARQAQPAGSIARLSFLILGLLGAAALYVAFDLFWGSRLSGVRRRMVKKAALSEAHDG